jgi:predicted metal-binding protein
MTAHRLHLCKHCQEIQAERAAIHEFDGGATRAQAEELAKGERCGEHSAQSRNMVEKPRETL